MIRLSIFYCLYFIFTFPFLIKAQHSVELSSVSGLMVSHSDVTNNLNLRKSLGFQSTVLWKLPPNNSTIPTHPASNYRYLGFSVYGMDMGDGFLNGNKTIREQLIGMGIGAGGMMIAGANIHSKNASSKNDLRVQCGFGPMLVTKYYNPVTNPLNLAISSTLNFGSLLKGQFLHQLSKSSTLTTGLELFHVSNSNLQKPNNGLNYFQASIGWMQKLHETASHQSTVKGKPYKDRCYYIGKPSEQFASTFQVSFRMAYRKYRSDYPVYYPVWILEGDYGFTNKKINVAGSAKDQQPLPKGEWRIGFDLFHENAATAKSVNGTLLSIDPRWELGLYGRRVFRVGFVDIFIDLGTYLIPPKADRVKLLQKSKWLYNSFGTQYRISKNVFLIYRMKAHYHVADYLEMGLVGRL
ncbi:MAG: hypothetical protein RL634_2109 [Bacteroidota bacterium]